MYATLVKLLQRCNLGKKNDNYFISTIVFEAVAFWSSEMR